MTLLTDRDATTTSRTPALTRGDASPATPRHERRTPPRDLDSAFTRTTILAQLSPIGPTLASTILEALVPEQLKGFARRRALNATHAILEQLRRERLVKRTGYGWIARESTGVNA